MKNGEIKKVNEVMSKDENVEASITGEDEKLEDLIEVAEAKKEKRLSVKNFFVFILRTIIGVVLGLIFAVFGAILAFFLIGICVAIFVFLTMIYGTLISLISILIGIIGGLATTIYAILIGFLVLLAILGVIVCICRGFILGFESMVSWNKVEDIFKKLNK